MSPTSSRLFASLYRLEVLMGRLYSEKPAAEGTRARFEPAENFEEVQKWFEKANASDQPYEHAWQRFVQPLRLSLVFPGGGRTGDFVMKLEGEKAEVTWKVEESRESGE